MKRYAWTIAAVVGLAAMAIGLGQGQGASVLAWARVLCAACIGLSD